MNKATRHPVLVKWGFNYWHSTSMDDMFHTSSREVTDVVDHILVTSRMHDQPVEITTGWRDASSVMSAIVHANKSIGADVTFHVK